MHVLAVKLNIEYTLTNTQCITTTLVIVTYELSVKLVQCNLQLEANCIMPVSLSYMQCILTNSYGCVG